SGYGNRCDRPTHPAAGALGRRSRGHSGALSATAPAPIERCRSVRGCLHAHGPGWCTADRGTAALAEIPGCIAASGQVRFSTGRCRAGGAGTGAQPAGNGLRNRSPAVADAGGGRGLMASQVQARPSVASPPWGCASMRIRSADTGAMSARCHRSTERRTAEGLARTGRGGRLERLSYTLPAGSQRCALTGRMGMMEVVVRVAAWLAAEAGAPARLDLLVLTPERTYPVFIAGHGLQPQPGVEAGAVLGLMAAMRTGLPLRVEGALSETFLRGVGCYMQRFTAAFPEFKAVEVRPASVYQAGSASTGRCASFFSGGVDSFFTLMKGKQRITDIIYIHGFDVRLDDLPRREAVDAMGQAVAQEMG